MARPLNLVQDNVRYSLHKYQNSEQALREVEIFHKDFIAKYKQMYEKYNVLLKPIVKVRLCANAQCFGKLTRFNWFVGGVFNSESNYSSYEVTSLKKTNYKKRDIKALISDLNSPKREQK
jgi:hypothetical protein